MSTIDLAKRLHAAAHAANGEDPVSPAAIGTLTTAQINAAIAAAVAAGIAGLDDVLGFANLAAFPATGLTNTIYEDLNTNLLYRWSGSSYVQVGGGAGASGVSAFNGRTGSVSLTKADVTATGLAASDVAAAPYTGGTSGQFWGPGGWATPAGTGAGVTTFQGRAGVVSLTKADVTGTGLAASDIGADTAGAAGNEQTRALAAEAGLLPKPTQYGLGSKFATWASNTYDAREFQSAGNPLVNPDGSVANISPIWAAFVTALAGVTKPRRLWVPDGTYNAIQAGSLVANYAMRVTSLLGIVGESRQGTIIQSDAGSCPFHYTGTQTVDVEIGNMTIDCSAQVNSAYTTQLKAIFVQDMLRPHLHDLTIIGSFATSVGCDFLQDYLFERLLIINAGRGIGLLGKNPATVSGGSAIGIGTGKYQSEPGLVTDVIAHGAGRVTLFYEKQSSGTYYSRGHVARGVQSIGAWAAVQDCGCDGLDADVVATDGTYGMYLAQSTISSVAASHGRVRLHAERNSGADVAVGNAPNGVYEITGVGRSTTKVTVLTGGTVGPNIMVDLVPDSSKFLATAGNTITVTNPGTQNATVGTAITQLNIAATDSATGQTLTYTAANLPAGLSINSGTGAITGTPTAASSGPVTVTVTDTTGAAGAVSFTWTVSAGAGGNTITVTNPGTQNAVVGTPVNLQIAATDSGGASMTFSSSTLPAGLSCSSSGLIAGTPTATGTTSTTINVADTTGAVGSVTFSFAVSSAAGAPLLADNFTAVDGSTLNGRPLPDGTNTSNAWGLTDTGTGDGAQIISNAVKATAGSNTLLITTDSTHSDGTVQFAITALNASPTGIISGGVFRQTSGSGNCMEVTLRQSATVSGYAVVGRVSNVSTIVCSSTQVPAVGDVVKVIFVGTTVTLFVNGVQLATGTINSSAKGSGLVSNTKHGIFTNFTDPTTALDSWLYSTATS